jgi:DNA uptake protein ComE-like DNA-binding protein
MKTGCIKIALTAASLLLAANLAFAVEVKVATPDVSGAAKATSDKTKATAAGAKGAVADTKASAAATKDAAKGAAADTKAGAKSAAADAKAAATAKLIDINTATEAELKAIPGIGDTYAAKIIAGRPYAKKDQLKSRKILPVPVYENTKDLIIAKQPAKPAADKKK